jgi:transposase-like protein
MSIIFPLTDVLDPVACYRWFESMLWPEGRVCPRCGKRDRLIIQTTYRAPLLDYQCQHCAKVFNLFSGTVFSRTHHSLPELYAIVRGVAQGVSTRQLSRELGCSYQALLDFRHKLQGWIAAVVDASPPVAGAVCEVDEMYQNAGEKRHPPHRSGRPAAAAGQPSARPRHLGQRPGAGGRGGGPKEG